MNTENTEREIHVIVYSENGSFGDESPVLDIVYAGEIEEGVVVNDMELIDTIYLATWDEVDRTDDLDMHLLARGYRADWRNPVVEIGDYTEYRLTKIDN